MSVENYKELNQNIDNLDFKNLKYKLYKSKEINKEKLDIAEKEYKKFLILVKMYPKSKIIPTKLVDMFWHNHILDTQSYHKDCTKIFGYYLHHYPYFGIFNEESKKDHNKSFEITKKLYFKHFGKYITAKNMKNSYSSESHFSDCGPVETDPLPETDPDGGPNI